MKIVRFAAVAAFALLAAPQDLRTADATRASEIYGGRFAFAGMALFGLVLVVLYRMVVTERRLQQQRVAVEPSHPASAPACAMSIRALPAALFSSLQIGRPMHRIAEVLVLIGYYTSVALGMKVHEVPIPQQPA